MLIALHPWSSQDLVHSLLIPFRPSSFKVPSILIHSNFKPQVVQNGLRKYCIILRIFVTAFDVEISDTLSNSLLALFTVPLFRILAWKMIKKLITIKGLIMRA